MKFIYILLLGVLFMFLHKLLNYLVLWNIYICIRIFILVLYKFINYLVPWNLYIIFLDILYII
jgi:hypothetical protein